MNKLLMIPAAMLLSTAAAAPKISAQSIIVNPTQPALSVSVRVNKDTTGNANPTYRVGENISISTSVNRDAYVYLFNVDANGEVTQILPNRLGGENFVKANTTVTFPRAGANFTFTVGEDLGLNKVLALASLTQLNLDQISSFRSQQDQFATVSARGQNQLAQALSIVVNPIPQNSWVTDTAFFSVVGQTPVQTGSLFVGTNVSNATVTLNGQRLGSANTTFSSIRPGTYPVRVQAPGYRDFTTTITVRAGVTTNLNVDFAQAVTPAPAPIVNQFTLSIRSNVANARVFVDGREVGTIRNGGLSVSVARGSHEVVLIAPGFRTFVNTYNVTRNAQITITPAR
ncbi:PEGA domain-containing protein [Deinococcus sp. MIMF12]|uniref:PEGA domain-containing protein n=1 Tax=Deinococcus rhizophilus TaxID=3049544 RepID=A0ABT7JMA7_9DEIO|nr:PEGA domain-containing protein [Deinococcus rhizophilus]MDL2345573.1 PEGA domain-containing protein [Deinococcus rhizophilus]